MDFINHLLNYIKKMVNLLGYNYIITSKELADDYDDYTNQNIDVYTTLKDIIETIKTYIKKNKIKNIDYCEDLDEFVEENEGEYFEPVNLVNIGDSEYIIIKCVYAVK